MGTTEGTPNKDWLKRWIYTKETLSQVFNKIPNDKKVIILEKALDLMDNKGFSKWYSIACVLNCGYDEAGYYWRKTKIRPNGDLKNLINKDLL